MIDGAEERKLLQFVLGFLPEDHERILHPDQAKFLMKHYAEQCAFESEEHFAFTMSSEDTLIEISKINSFYFIKTLPELNHLDWESETGDADLTEEP